MGFGILFLGYSAAFIGGMTPFGAYAHLFGAVLMLIALSRLSEQNIWFSVSFFTVIAFALTAVFRIVNDLFGLLASLTVVIEYVEVSLVLILHFVLMYAIITIAKETKIAKIEYKAKAALVMTAIYYAMTLIGMIAPPFLADIRSYWNAITLILAIFWIFTNMLILFSCYMWICYEGEENMERSSSPFRFVNKINDRSNAIFRSMREKRIKEKSEKKNRKK